MKRRFAISKALLAAAAAGAVGLAGMAPAFAAESPSKKAVDADACAQFVQRPQILKSDTRPDGTPIPEQDPQGATPVVFVHGWVSKIAHDEGREGYFSHYVASRANGHAGTLLAKDDIHSSMIGLVQQVPGAQPYTFDYSQVGSHWVTDPQIGAKLANGLSCLAKQYGKPAVVVTHSMGGLAIREALGKMDPTAAQEAVSDVVAIAPPNKGSDIAGTLNETIEGASDAPLIGLPVRLADRILKGCAAKMDEKNEGCIGVPVVDAFRGWGGQALRPDSPELAALPQIPQGIHVTNLAGDIQIGGLSLFGKTTKPVVSLGDTLVTTESATAGADEAQVQTCRYAFVSTWGAKEDFDRLKLLPKGDSVERPATIFDTPCAHEALLREVNTNEAVVKVVRERAAQQDQEVAGEQ